MNAPKQAPWLQGMIVGLKLATTLSVLLPILILELNQTTAREPLHGANYVIYLVFGILFFLALMIPLFAATGSAVGAACGKQARLTLLSAAFTGFAVGTVPTSLVDWYAWVMLRYRGESFMEVFLPGLIYILISGWVAIRLYQKTSGPTGAGAATE